MEKDGCSKDIEGCKDGLEVPFLHDYSSKMDENNKGSVSMVVLSTCVAVCGSFEFGSCVGYSAPTQSAIRTELDLSIAQQNQPKQPLQPEYHKFQQNQPKQPILVLPNGLLFNKIIGIFRESQYHRRWEQRNDSTKT